MSTEDLPSAEVFLGHRARSAPERMKDKHQQSNSTGVVVYECWTGLGSRCVEKGDARCDARR